MTNKILLAGPLLALCLTGCSDDDPAPAVVLEGQFLDSAVSNLKFTTASQAGATDSIGTFSFVSGETITFSIGDIGLPAAQASTIMTPLDLTGAANVTDSATTNIARLLLTLDTDAIASNGISIDAQAHTAATGLSVDFSSDQFDAQVANLVANSGSVQTELISAATAQQHLQGTIDALSRTASQVDLQTSAIVIDGGLEDWATITPLIEDSAEDGSFSGSAAADFKNLSAAFADDELVLLYRLNGSVQFPHTESVKRASYDVNMQFYSDSRCQSTIGDAYVSVFSTSAASGFIYQALFSDLLDESKPITMFLAGDALEMTIDLTLLPIETRYLSLYPNVKTRDAQDVESIVDGETGFGTCVRLPQS